MADIAKPETSIPCEVPAFRCTSCRDTGHVCECHPGRSWGGVCCDGPRPPASRPEVLCEHGACHCGGAGMPCPACCSPIPEDGTHSITEAFTPDWMRISGDPVAALEPGTLPEHPLRAQDCEALIPKEIG